nr:MAG TPA: hypothetical protein [Caudoviricetes sp.]
MNTKLKNSYGFLEKRQISRYNVNIAVFVFQKETKTAKNVPRGTFRKGESICGKILRVS